MLIEPGQVLTLNMQVSNSGLILYGHPYLVLYANEDNNYIEIAQVDSLKGKEFKAARKTNKIIFCDEPQETVIDKDSYIQLDNLLRIEYFDELVLLRRQQDKLSINKFNDVLHTYEAYQSTHFLDENKQVYLSRSEITAINNKLLRT